MTPPEAIAALLTALAEGRVDRRTFVRRAGALGLSVVAASSILAACRPKAEAAPAADAPLPDLEPELHVYNWSDYVAPDTIGNFEKEFGVRVVYQTYESNEELVARVRAAGTGIDVVVPTNYAASLLAGMGRLLPLRRRYLTNFGNLAPAFVGPPYDPDNRFTVPYQWGTTGLAIRSDKVTDAPDSWGVLLNPAYRGRMTQMNDMREVIGAWLRYRGKSLNSVELADMAQARTDAMAARDNLLGYVSAPVKPKLVSGEVWVAQLWNGDTAQAEALEPSIRYVLPLEGSTVWTDAAAVLADAPHPRAAHEFLNYLLRPEVSAAIAGATGYGSPNQAALARIPNPLPFPTAAEFQRLEYARPLGEDVAMWVRIWQDLNTP